MSFWPFTNTFNNNTKLQKFLDGISDFSQVTIDHIISDIDLSQELLNELHSIKGNYKGTSGFSLSQLQQSQLQQPSELQPLQSSGHLSPPSPIASTSNSQYNSNNQVTIQVENNDTNSITSSNTDYNNTSKDPRGLKLIELLIQSQILNGLLDYIVDSVDFFHELNEKENEKLEKLLKKDSQSQEQDSSDLSETEPETEPETQREDDDEGEDDGDDNDNDEDLETPEEKMRRCIQFSADILSIDLWVISNRIIDTPSIMDKLWSILYLDNLRESSPTVNHVVRILDQLMNTNSVELLNFIRRRDDLVDTFLAKLEVPLLMDFFLRIIQSDKPDSPSGVIDILYEQDLIPKLVDILKPHESQFETSYVRIPNHQLFFKQTAATDFIKALITISSNTALAVVIEANIGPNQLTRQLVSKEIISQMVNDIMLYTKEDTKNNVRLTNKHGINNVVGIVIELIRKNNSDYDLNCGSYSSLLTDHNNETTEINSYVMFQWLKDFEQNPPNSRDPIFLGEMLAIFSDKLDDFNSLIQLEPELPSKVNANANILGFTRFRISELIAELLHCSNMILINSKMIRKINEIRDIIRDRQGTRLKKALEDDLENSVENLSGDLNDVSLEDITPIQDQFEVFMNGENGDFSRLVESLNMDAESDDEEPTISPQNPFVGKDRDTSIRANSSVGDYFKIKLNDSNILINIISKFTEFPWHNFFHNVVFDLIQQIFNGKLNSYNSFLIANLFQQDGYNLTKVIIEAYRNDEYELRPGYLGHLILISEEVVKFTSLYKPDLISPLIVDSIRSDDWKWFVDEVLLKTREVYNVVLGAEDDERNEDDEDVDDDSGIPDVNGFNDNTAKVIATAASQGLYQGNQFKKSTVDDAEDGDDDDDGEEDEDDEAEDNLMSTMSGVRIQDMSPKPEELNNDDVLSDDYDQEVENFTQDGFLENLSESSSSDEEDQTTENKLTRVKKHNA